jgi:hypothetical protein
MQEEDARLALLQTELNAIQAAIRGLDTIVFQIKGWCVTASLAIGGFAVAYHRPALLTVGAAAVVGFCLVNCQFKTFQRAFINRNMLIDAELRRVGVMEVLKGAGSIDIVGTAPIAPTLQKTSDPQVNRALRAIWNEARMPHTFGLYLFIVVCLGVEALVLV